MKEKEQWYSVAEIAEKAGISPQAVYKRLTTSLSTFTKVEKGRKLVSSKALGVLKQPTVKQQTTNNNSTVESAAMLSTLNRTIELLQQQLEVKDKQIESLDKRLEQALKNSSESHFVLAQQQHKAIGEKSSVDGVKRSWFKRFFGNNKEEDTEEI